MEESRITRRRGGRRRTKNVPDKARKEKRKGKKKRTAGGDKVSLARTQQDIQDLKRALLAPGTVGDKIGPEYLKSTFDLGGKSRVTRTPRALGVTRVKYAPGTLAKRPPPSGDPVQDAVAAVAQAGADPRYGHLQAARVRRMEHAMRDVVPGVAATDAPFIPAKPKNMPGRPITNPGARGEAAYGPPQGGPGPAPPLNPAKPSGGPPNQPEYPTSARAEESDLVEEKPLAGQTSWVAQDDADPREGMSAHHFFENTLQTIHDDRTREMAFALVDSGDLRVKPSLNPAELTLFNKNNNDLAVSLTEEEFKDAMTFFAKSDAPLATAPVKTKQFFSLLERPRSMAWLFSSDPKKSWWWSRERPTSEAIDHLVDEAPLSAAQKEIARSRIQEQATLDHYRDKLEPARYVRRRETWGDFFKKVGSLGLLRPDANAPMRPWDIANKMEGASQQAKSEMAQVLKDMQAAGRLSWNAKGELVLPRHGGDPSRVATGTNISMFTHNGGKQNTRRRFGVHTF